VIEGIQDLLSVGGNARRGMKILVFGPTGSGKSPFLASFPRPLMVIDCGEGGIQPYLKAPLINGNGEPKVDMDRVFRGEEDLCVTVQGPEQMDRAVDFGLKHEDKFNSLVIDGYNLNWEDHMDYWNDRLGGDIQGGQWRVVKGPWKARQKRLMRSSLNVGFSAWLRDIAYDQVQARPNSKPTLNIHAQEVANIEKSVPYTVDIVFQLRVVTDKLNRPTPNHEIIVVKARRPATVDPKDLFVGKKVTWRSDKTENLWALGVAPYVDGWKDARITDIVDFIGMDAEQAVHEEREINAAADDAEAGRLVRQMFAAYDKGEIKDMKQFAAFWQSTVAPTINSLGKEAQLSIVEAKDALKNKIENGGTD
jgi:hypothetical protein